MSLKAVSGIMLMLLIMSMIALVFYTRSVKASESIYIRADGSIDPPTAPISSFDNLTYVLTGPISESTIFLQRSNIIFDGNKNSIASGFESGLILSAISNVSILNTTISGTHPRFGGNGDGIVISYSSNVTISNVHITGYAIVVSNSTNVKVHDSELTYGATGISISSSLFINIYKNNITSQNCVSLSSSSFNIISENNILPVGIVGSGWSSVNIYNSSFNTFFRNDIGAGDNKGVSLVLSSNNTFYENNITSASFNVLSLSSSSDNKFYHNNFMDILYPNEIIDSVNRWDDGYPSGGNYWSDYAGVDLYSGQYQNEGGIDGIGDIVYSLNDNNNDNFPLTRSFEHYLQEAPFSHFT